MAKSLAFCRFHQDPSDSLYLVIFLGDLASLQVYRGSDEAITVLCRRKRPRTSRTAPSLALPWLSMPYPIAGPIQA